MVRCVAVQNPTRADLARDKDVQNRCGHGREEVAGKDRTCVIENEGRPTLTGWLPRTPTLQVLADGTRIYEQTQFERQLVSDLSFAPTWILPGHRHYECAQVRRQRWTTGVARLVAPE